MQSNLVSKLALISTLYSPLGCAQTVTNTNLDTIIRGQPFTITWTDPNYPYPEPHHTLSLDLVQGALFSSTLSIVGDISDAPDYGNWTWTPSPTLPKASNYAFRLKYDNTGSTPQYSKKFTIGDAPTTTSSESVSSAQSSTESSSSSLATSPAATTTPDKGRSSLSAGAAAGIAIAGLLGLLILLVLIYWAFRSRRDKRRTGLSTSAAVQSEIPEMSAGEKSVAVEIGPALTVEEEREWRARKRAVELEGRGVEIGGDPRAELEALRRGGGVHEM